MSLSLVLKGAGYDVETGANGREGITKLTDGVKPSVVLTDLNMPELDGIGFIKEARKIPAMRSTPIIVLTTEASGRKRDEARAAGASGWLTKPAEPNQLLSVVKQLCPR
ncbi:two-component system chemotaxis response regulator CheY [Acidocella aromatica]|uniref:Two-component system chemotaxis response regulator CheY n=2 Tax=Acidocella aromatica TaxID=1303579 RepID=A0A840VQ57_9PROT|nr:two-component system chemotaxis response regulator CheY [Acidocella aromatica]